MRRILLVLTALCIMSSCFAGSTLAKYTSEAIGVDSARVAKWGVGVTATGDEAFSMTYKGKSVAQQSSNTVVSKSDGVAVVAPGTEGTLGSMTLVGTPEVSVSIRYEVDFELGDKWVYSDGTNSEFYCPLYISVGDVVISQYEYPDSERFEQAVEDAVAEALGESTGGIGKISEGVYEKTVLAGTELDASVEILWDWPFTNTDAATKYGDEVAVLFDNKDLYLGMQAYAGNAASVSFSIKGSVTQID